MPGNKTNNLSKHGDYDLLGRDGILAVEKGLANAKWYESPIAKKQLHTLLKRRDDLAIRDSLLWFALLFIFGGLGVCLWGSWWAILPFAIYGVLYASVSDSRWHETSHGTAFKTDWMNNALYELASFMVLRESVVWRWSHTRHHSDTIIIGRDLEIAVPRPVNLFNVALKFFALNVYPNYTRSVISHCFGKMAPVELTFIPETEHQKIYIRARIYVLIYAGVIALAFVTRSFLPLMLIGLPNLYGSWLTVIYGLTQHAGLAENVLDHRLNTRTVYMNFINRYLYWNMGYHIEHHIFPLVPYYNLPKLHALIRTDMPTPYLGLLVAYQEIVPTLLRQSKDPDYFVRRQLPPPSDRTKIETVQAITAQGKPVVDGWIEVCSGELLETEDVLRFDHENKTYAIYRAADGAVYATDGICTHGNAHLADGLVKGTIIECAKHNGRYDMRDGSPQRLPVCVGVKTYSVRESEGRLSLNLLSAGGYGVTAVPVAYGFRVISNENVTTFIKELVLEYEDPSARFDYQPGDYLQFEIPAYAERTLQELCVQLPYEDIWRAQQIFDLQAANPVACHRNYSMASNPDIEEQLRFNVRLATPLRGQSYPAGVGSAYLFSLKTGDRVVASGPYGEFHIKETGREMVYLGGGSGMAPLRAHLSYLLETCNTPARVSYWYGARSRMELFYQDYFDTLARKHKNFTYRVALSEALPEDDWQGSSGFIHEVLKREYLDSHPDPAGIDYYLCGPPAMIQAAHMMLSELGVPPAQINFDEF